MEAPAIQSRRATEEEYLRFEAESPDKHEFADGQIIDMAGGTLEHSQIISNTIGELRAALKGKPCMVLESNMQVRIARKHTYRYPDASVVCGEPQLDTAATGRRTLLNPKLIVEVLSPSTEGIDRGKKFSGYREITSFEEFVLISSDEPMIEVYYRQPDGIWRFTPARGMDASISLSSIGVTLKLAEVYAGVTFPPLEEQSDPPRNN